MAFFLKKKQFQNKGQITAEYLLLAVFLIGLFGLVTKILRENDFLKNFQDKPTKLFKNVVENGNWEFDPKKSQARHPNQFDTHYSPKAKEL